MRILIHDRSGHPFTVQLSRELAKRGHHILHSYAEFFQCPKGDFIKKLTDPSNFNAVGIKLSKPFQKYSFIKRRFQEAEYAKLLVGQIKKHNPQIAILGNMPMDPIAFVYKKLRGKDIKFVLWVQDLYGIAIKRILSKKLPLLGNIIGEYYIRLERRLIKQSDKVILITEDFLPLMQKWRVEENKMHVVPNWAPLEEIPVRSKENEWSKKQGVSDKLCLLYSGTMGMKHNPDLLLQLAFHFRKNEMIKVVVISEGLGADWLKQRKLENKLDNLIILEFQPFEQLPNVLAAADILIAILEAEADMFSVPSKVLSYLCAQRSLLLAVPPKNLAARIVSQNKAGIVVHPTDVDSFIKAADSLVTNASLRQEYADNALSYANKHFSIQRIGDKFEEIIGSRL